MMQNSLFLQRLRIMTLDNKIAYDEQFHKGVNIIRGQNSSGKSTIIRFIFFALGGAYSEFVPEALQCKYVMAEVCINGDAVVTLKRYLEVNQDKKVNSKAPMYIYYGTLDECLEDKRKDVWQKFGYISTDKTKSFSNVLFKMLGLPEVKADSNITMHQILRLIYLDQESPTNSLFFFEIFDKELTRETIAEILLGVYDEELYDAKSRLLDIKTELKENGGMIKLANSFLSDPMTKSSAAIQSYINNQTEEISKLTDEIAQLRTSNIKVKVKNREYEKLQAQITSLRREQLDLENEVKNLSAEILDSKFFIITLQKKIKALDSSIATRDYLEKLPLEYCPECLSKLDENVPEGHCRLCKSPVDTTHGKSQAARIKLEIEFQVKESEQLLNINERYLLEKKAKLQAVNLHLQTLQKQLDNSLKDVRSTFDEHLNELILTKGYKEGEILQYKTLLETAIKYEEILKQFGELKEEESKLTRFINAKASLLQNKRKNIEDAISKNGIYLLQHDKLRQQEFKIADGFVIDYKQNIAYISNHYIKLSASSSFYLKMAARFAIFLTSLQNNEMRYPRLLFSDNMEDKGMEEERAKDFQRTIISYLNEIGNTEYQLIYATSMCADEYDNEQYVVGEKYSEGNKSLKNV